MKKQLLTIAIFLSSVSVFAQQIGAWITQSTNFTDASSGVRNISVVDSNTVWICSYDGAPITTQHPAAEDRQDFSMTSDGGFTWTTGGVPAPTTHNWSMIYGISSTTAWAVFYNSVVGSGGGIWKTTDGGATWNQQGAGSIFNASSFPNVVHFWNDTIGFAMGDPNPGTQYEIYTTTDGGTNWNRVPAGNIPASISGEFGIVAHYNVIGDTVWFDTNKGRVYRSIDRGLNWTVSSTGITVPTNEAIDICFSTNTNGLARHYSATGVNTMKITTDGGDTWSAATPVGNFWGSDVKRVPEIPGMMVSTGAATNLSGSSYSTDYGLTWNNIDSAVQHTALGVLDSLTMWSGNFNGTGPNTGGIFKYILFNEVLCNDVNINTGTSSTTALSICPNEKAILSSVGTVAPTEGDFAGDSWAISSADISGSPDVLGEPSFIGSFRINFPTLGSTSRELINDSTLIGIQGIPFGTYYFTPVLYGNAVSAIAPDPVNFLHELTLDPNCTFVGSSVAVAVLSGTDPSCIAGISNLDLPQIALFASQVDASSLQLTLNAVTQGKAIITMYDLSGRLVSTQTLYVSKGSNREMIDVANLASGTYMIKAEFNGTHAQTKAVKF